MKFLISVLCWGGWFGLLYGQAAFQRVYHDVGNVGLAITNVGTIGKPDVRLRPDDGPSMRYPIHSGIEHLFEGGLWIGAQVGGQIRVSTAAVDAPSGYNTGLAGFEFTALESFQQRSTLPASPFFSTTARSHQDFLTRFTDSNQIIPGTSIKIPEHDFPLRAVVQLRSMAWQFSFAEYFVILEYTITNASSQPWDSVYVGLYTDLVVRNVLVTRDAGTAFFNKGGAGWLDSLFAVYVYQVSGDDLDYTQTYAASQALGIQWRGHFLHPLNGELPDTLRPAVMPNFWTFRNSSGGDFSFPATDVEKYYRLSHGMNLGEGSPLVDILRQPGNRIQLVSIGPIPRVAPGESFTYVHALVCAPQLPDPTDPTTADSKARRRQLEEHLGWALRSFLGEDRNANGRLDPGEDLNRNGRLDHFILPEPPRPPHVRVEAGRGVVDIYWDDASLESIDPISRKKDFEGFRLYLSEAGADLQGTPSLKLAAQWDKPGNAIGTDNGFDAIRLDTPRTFPGDSHQYHFHYRLEGILGGWQYVIALTAFDEGDPELEVPPLESSLRENSFSVFPGPPPGGQQAPAVFPNPYVLSAAWDGPTSRLRKIYFYNLPPECTIRIFTLDGEVVAEMQHSNTQQGQDIQWFRNFAAQENVVIEGGVHAWDLLTRHGQFIRTGLYLFSVTDHSTGETKTGKFAVVK